MTEMLYLHDSYLRETEATVIKTMEKGIVLDQTVFYPRGGGQQSDTGTITIDGTDYKVSEVVKKDGEVVHVTDEHIPDAQPTKTVHLKIDWEGRYAMMKYHTALHLLSHVAHRLYGAQTAGNQISPDKARIDLTLEKTSEEIVREMESETNDIISLGLDVCVMDIPREEAVKEVDPEKTRLDLLPEAIKSIRLVKVGDVDTDACAGTHVANTKEIGGIRITKVVNKGKNRKRIELVLV